ncbi:fibronectin type III domain-containing protein [Dawidia soli]|uniref:Fibronectin type III domain-containing protein n=1 Tax=Dawidia soli TaxID=2782352 RepID=A0AAP2GIU4_9BACT|nr:fibronectin type III domain-containing protein [Dawidia soli]MBT1688701.1 fibronectin type III domain-containing protein [Dawidia soli]
MRRIVILILVIAASLFRAQAQTYPVQATTQLMPPYSLYLADYVSAGSERIALNLYLADIARPTLDVRFRLRIVGQGVTLETKAEYIPAPVSVQGGVPLRLISTDLAEYFNPNNLNFQGMSRQEYNRAGKLPEGVYQFCFEVLEYNRGVKISNTACAMAWLVLNDPPIINLPSNGAKLKAQDPQNVLLQWTPRHTGSPNSAFNTEYDVRMVEIWPATRNPNDAILSSPPIFETTTTNTTVIYGPAETPLEPGRRYAFRVRARSIVGLDEIDLFKNRGYSEVFTFTYGDPCDLPTGITAASISPTRFSLSWQTMFSHTAYRVRYREVGTTNWYENNVTLNSSEITGLKPGTQYEYQVAANCGFYSGQYSEVARVTTAETPEAEYACGVPLETFKLDPAALAGSLKVGDIIQAGDFDVKLTRVSGGNGVFTGEGIIEVPYFNKAKVNTTFSSITVNKELRMVNGHLNVTGAAVDVIPERVTDFIEDLNETLDVIDSALNTIEENLPESFDPNSFVADTLIDVKDGIHSVYKDDDGSIVIVDKNGNTQTLPPGTAAAIKDDNGKGFLVDKKGNIHPTTSDVAAKAGNRTYNLVLTFADHANARYGFDKKQYELLAKQYETLKSGYNVSWKAVASGAADVVNATLDASGIDASKIKFEKGGMAVAAAPMTTGSPAAITVQGGQAGDEEGLLAVYAAGDSTGKEQVLGKLNVVTYDEIQRHLVVVAVNNVKYPADNVTYLQQRLNKIYGQGVVHWTVTLDNQGVTGVEFGNPFDVGETGLMSNYTDDMKAVIRAYKDQMDDDKYYLFLVSNPSTATTFGYMPRSKQAGFIFMDKHGGSEDLLAYTMAHELGHGAFNLDHTFKEYSALSKGSTDNLMDYTDGAGTRLYKYQWDRMRFPDIVVGMFEEDADAGLGVRGKYALEDEFLNDDQATFTFLTPAGTYITLPKRIKKVGFQHGFSTIEEAKDSRILVGSLLGFELDGVAYNALNGGGGRFYLGEGGSDSKIYDDPTLKDHVPNYVIAAINRGDGLNITKYAINTPLTPYTPSQELKVRDQDFDASIFVEANERFKRSIGDEEEEGPDGEELPENQYSVTSGENDLTEDHADKPTILLVNKIAQIRNLYPMYFSSFTKKWENWNELSEEGQSGGGGYNPTTGTGLDMSSFTYGPWDIKVGGDGELFRKWDAGTPQEKLEFYRVMLQELCDHVAGEVSIRKDFWRMLNINTSWVSLVNALGYLNEEDFKALTIDQRIIAIQILADNAIYSQYEDYTLKLFSSAPTDEDKNALLDALVSIKTPTSKKFLLPALCRDGGGGLDNPQFSEFAALIVGWVQEKRAKPDIGDLMTLLTNPNPPQFRQIPFSGNFFDGNDESFDENGNINLSTKIWQEGCMSISSEMTGQEYDKDKCYRFYSLNSVPPFEYVSIKFMKPFTLGDVTYKTGSSLYVPAIFAYMLFNNENLERIVKSVKFTLDAVIIASSAGSMTAAVIAWEGGVELSTAWMFAKATADMGIAVADITAIVKQGDLEQTKEGRQLLHDWNEFTHLYWNIRLGGDMAANANAKLQDFAALLRKAMANNRTLGGVQLTEEMIANLRNMCKPLIGKEGITLTEEMLNGVSGGSSPLRNGFNDFKNQFNTSWKDISRGGGGGGGMGMGRYEFPNGIGSYGQRGVTIANIPRGTGGGGGAVAASTETATAVLVETSVQTAAGTQAATKPMLEMVSGSALKDALALRGFKTQMAESGIGVVTVPTVTEQVEVGLMEGSMFVNQQGKLYLMKPAERLNEAGNCALFYEFGGVVQMVAAEGLALAAAEEVATQLQMQPRPQPGTQPQPSPEEDPNRACTICTQRANDVCVLLEDIWIQKTSRSAVARTGIGRICLSILTDADIRTIGLKLLGESNAETTAFLEDLTRDLSNRTDALGNNLGSIDEALINAYLAEYNAFSGVDTRLRRDINTLFTIRDIMTEQAQTARLNRMYAIMAVGESNARLNNAKNGNFETRLNVFLDTYRDVACGLAGNIATNELGTLEYVWDNIQYFIQTYDGKPGVDRTLGGRAVMNSNFVARKGAHHMLRHLREQRITAAQINTIDGVFEINLDDICGGQGCEYDVKFTNGNYWEYKSYNSALVNRIATAGRGSKFFNQFLSYLGQNTVNSFDDMQYVFELTSGVNESDVRRKFKDMFILNEDDIFNAIDAKVDFRTDLFPNNVSAEQVVVRRRLFAAMIRDEETELFDFVVVQ